MYRRKNRYTRFLIKSNKRIVFRMIRVVFLQEDLFDVVKKDLESGSSCYKYEGQ